LQAPNLSSIAADFNFDDKQRDRMLGGFIAAAFYMVGKQCRRRAGGWQGCRIALSLPNSCSFTCRRSCGASVWLAE
jgi:hypothetical protein